MTIILDSVAVDLVAPGVTVVDVDAPEFVIETVNPVDVVMEIVAPVAPVVVEPAPANTYVDVIAVPGAPGPPGDGIVQVLDQPDAPSVFPGYPYLRIERDDDGDIQGFWAGTVN